MSLETGKTFAEFLKKNVSKTEDGKEDVQKLLKEGKKDEAAKASKSIRMAMPDGSRKMTVTASREFPAFNSVKYCYIDDNYKINRSLDKDVCESLAKEYADLLGMKD